MGVATCNLGCAGPLDSGEDPFQGVGAACWCPSWTHSGYLPQSPCRAYHLWACAPDAGLPAGSRQTPSLAEGEKHSEAQDSAPSCCGRNLGMGQVLDSVQELVQGRVRALVKALGGASRQGLWAWTSTLPASASQERDTGGRGTKRGARLAETAVAARSAAGSGCPRRSPRPAPEPAARPPPPPLPLSRASCHGDQTCLCASLL